MSAVAQRVVTPAVQFSEKTRSTRNEYQAKLRHIKTTADEVARAAGLIANLSDEVMAQGGTLSIQPQLAFLNAAWMRLVKDFGVAEHLQGLGAAQRRPFK